MDDLFSFSPVPKPKKKEKKPYQGIKTKKPLQKKPIKTKIPIYQEKRAKQKKSNKPEKAPREGIKPPKRSIRNEFTEADKKKIDKAFGGKKCAQCGNPNIEYHHAKFRSASAQGSGRGVWRNGIPLCKSHHDLCHDDYLYAQKWRDLLRSLYGEYYYMDKWDLWLAGLIEDPNEKEFEAFMTKQAL